jgi:hypothetical protein
MEEENCWTKRRKMEVTNVVSPPLVNSLLAQGKKEKLV